MGAWLQFFHCFDFSAWVHFRYLPTHFGMQSSAVSAGKKGHKKEEKCIDQLLFVQGFLFSYSLVTNKKNMKGV